MTNFLQLFPIFLIDEELCDIIHDRVLGSDEESPNYIGSERRAVLINDYVTFDHFDGQIKRFSESGSSPIKIMHCLKTETMSVRAHVSA